jgi:hypothetical protein
VKRFYLYLLFFVGGYGNVALAQRSHGGIPLFLNNPSLRSSYLLEYVEMPTFNVDSVKQIDELNKENMRTSFQFAYKFYTHIEKGKQGSNQVLADGTKVWRVGIRSKDAYSINLLFTKFHLPERGKLFLYNADHTHIIGSFDHRNNSPENILPVRPIAGDDIIVEYSEPADAAFEGELIIGEVNHDYRGILDLRAEPKTDDSSGAYLCMPDALCSDADETIIRSTVLLIINGTTTCTGTLVNNTGNDGKPYLLTAVHCLGTTAEYPHETQYYVDKAGTVIAFFNYNRAVCKTTMKATEEFSLASAYPRVIIERKDVALLELNEKPPVHYNAYYAGWNVDGKTDNLPYTNLHHPDGAVKRYGIYNNNLLLSTYYEDYGLLSILDTESHWKIRGWNTGSTHPGSSGSPLFDKNNRVVGTLTGGKSVCYSDKPNGQYDYFTALYKSWEQTDLNNQLKTYLDSANTGNKQQEGFDPHADNPLVRMSNANHNEGDNLIHTPWGNGFLFGNNDLNTIEEFAEEFNLEKSSEILGVYVFIPQMPFSYTSGVEIKIYEGNDFPQNCLITQLFVPQYLNYSNIDSLFHTVNKNTTIVPTESFVTFENPVKVTKKFFVAYKVNLSSSNRFCVYNTELTHGKPNTAWLKDVQWVKASEYTPAPITTSLALQPLLRFTGDSSIYEINKKSKKLYYDKLIKQLIFTWEPQNPGAIFIYSTTGQLIEQISFSKGEKSVQLTRPAEIGSIKIVKIKDGNDIFSEKIIY